MKGIRDIMDEKQIIEINDLSNINIYDESLYSYENAIFSLSKIEKDPSEILISKIEQLIDSFPVIQKAVDNMKSKVEYSPIISKEMKKLLQEGKAELIPCKNSDNAVYLQIRSLVNGLVVNGKEYGLKKNIHNIPLNVNTIPIDLIGAIQSLSTQNQLNKIAEGLKELSDICEQNFDRLLQGQSDDRLAKILSSRSCFIQALAMTDDKLKYQMLIQSIRDANLARAELAMQIKSDIYLLFNEKKPQKMDKIVSNINIAIIAMNNATQLLLYSYHVLGQNDSQIVVIKEYETFVRQMLLAKYNANGSIWERICSSRDSKIESKSKTEDFKSIPTKLINSCVKFYEKKSENFIVYPEVRDGNGM